MNPFTRLISGLGAQTAPFGFSPDDPNAAYRAGWGVIGDLGANLMANNQPGVSPLANLGASLQQAKQSATQRNKEAFTAQQLMEEAAAKKAERERQASEEAQREEFLNALPPDVQMKARSIPGFLEDYVKATDPAFQTAPELTADMRNFEYAQSHPEFAGFLRNGQSNTGKFGMTPVPLTDGKGGYAVGQLYEGGGLFLNGQPLDGTEWKPLAPYEQNFEKSSGTTAGKASAEAIAAAPGDIAAADLALEKINGLRADPNRTWGTGMTSVFNVIPGTPGYDYQAKVDEVTAGAFLTAIQELRGLGALSNAEGQTATQAVTRLKTATTEEGFMAALDDYEKVVARGKDRAARRLSSTNAPPQAGAIPDPVNTDPLGLR